MCVCRGGVYMGTGQWSLSYMIGEGETLSLSCDGALMIITEGE